MATKEIGRKFFDSQKSSSAWLWMEGGLLIMHSSPHICIIKWHFFCRRQIRKTISQSDTGVSIYFLVFFFFKNAAIRLKSTLSRQNYFGSTQLLNFAGNKGEGTGCLATRLLLIEPWQPAHYAQGGRMMRLPPPFYIRQKRRRLCNLAETLN